MEVLMSRAGKNKTADFEMSSLQSSEIAEHNHSSLGFDTSAGVISFNSESFIADVFNSVNDLMIGGFDSLEEFAMEALDLRNEGARIALRNGVDKIFHKVSDNIDGHLCQWEAICRAHYFNFADDTKFLNIPDNMAVETEEAGESLDVDKLQEQDGMLNTELGFLRSQKIMADTDSTKLRRELSLMEKKLALRSDLLGDPKDLSRLDGATLEDLMKSSSLVKNKVDEASQKFRHHSATIRKGNGNPEMNVSTRMTGLAQMRELLEEMRLLRACPEVASLEGDDEILGHDL